MSDAATVLRGVLDLLSDPDHWTQGEDALDIAGHRCDPTSDSAQCFCVGGAIGRVATDIGARWLPPVRALGDVVLGDSAAFIWQWNDAPERTHAEVMAALEAAIERAEAG